MTVDALIQSLDGHFVGLWTYRPVRKAPRVFWSVTFRDTQNLYWETDMHDSPVAALEEAQSVIEAQRRGERVIDRAQTYDEVLSSGPLQR
jgi:hypothetical protein